MPKTTQKKEAPSQMRHIFSGNSVLTTEGPTPDKIRKQAYAIYQARGCESGHELEDWVQAERELYEQYGAMQTESDMTAGPQRRHELGTQHIS